MLAVYRAAKAVRQTGHISGILANKRAFSSRITGVQAEFVPSTGHVQVTLDTHDGNFTAKVGSLKGHPWMKPSEKTDYLDSCEELNADLGRLLMGVDPTDQKGIENVVGNALVQELRLATSIAAVYAGAAACSMTPVRYLSSLSGVDEMRLPMPVYKTLDIPVSFIPFGAETADAAQKLVKSLTRAYRSANKGKVCTHQKIDKQLSDLYKILVELDMLGKIGLGVHVSESEASRKHLDKIIAASKHLPIALVAYSQPPGGDESDGLRYNTTYLSENLDGVLVCPFVEFDLQSELLNSQDSVNALSLDLCEFTSITHFLELSSEIRTKYGLTQPKDTILLTRSQIDPTFSVQLATSQGISAIFVDQESIDVSAVSAAMLATESSILQTP